METTLEQMTEYKARLEKRLKNTASAWMKSEIRKAIAQCDAEIAKHKGESK